MITFLAEIDVGKKREILMKSFLLLVTLLMTLSQLQAQAQNRVRQPVNAVPEVQSGEVIEPEITIIEQEDRTEHRYSVNGHVYMVKIVPGGSAPPYYLLDLDGDGMMDVRRDGPGEIAVPQWVLFRW